MGRRADGTFNTAPLKRYPVAFCRALGSIIYHSAESISHMHTYNDEYEQTFDELRRLYMESYENDDDGADYHPKEAPKRT